MIFNSFTLQLEHPRAGRRRLYLGVLYFLLFALPLALPHLRGAEPVVPAAPAAPMTEKEMHGRKLFVKLCAECHADDASGDEGPDLRGIDSSDQKIRRMIMQGKKGQMPAFKKLTDDDIASLIGYLRTLKEPAP